MSKEQDRKEATGLNITSVVSTAETRSALFSPEDSENHSLPGKNAAKRV